LSNYNDLILSIFIWTDIYYCSFSN